MRILALVLLPTLATAAPNITSFSPVTGPTNGGVQVTINGTGLDDNDPVFGDEEPVVMLNSQNVTVTSATPNQVKFILPAGQGQNLPLKLTLDSVSDIAPYSYSAPAINSVNGTPSTQGGSNLVISGSNFGLAGAGSVEIDGIAATVTSWSHSTIAVTAPAGEGTSIPVQVMAGNQSSNFGSFDYASPVINVISAASFPTQGGVGVNVSGPNFGTAASVTVNAVAAVVQSQTQNSLVFTLPAGQGSANDLVVTVGGQSSPPKAFGYDPPVIDSISPASGFASDATEITLAGMNFGSSPVVSFGTGTGTIVSATDDEIVFTRPTGEAGCLPVEVQVGDQGSGHIHFQSDVLTCPPGYFIDTGSSTVLPAPVGTYTPDPNMTFPTPAPIGFYTPIPGMSQPIPASPGYFVPNAGSAAQLPAPAGKFVPVAGAIAPLPAPPGTYAPIIGMSESIEASPGYYVPSVGASSQTAAPAGQFVGIAGGQSTQPAPVGSYAPIPSMRAAIPAPDGTYAPAPGSTSVLPVPPGNSSDGSELTPLPQVQIVAYNLLLNGDNELTFSTDDTQNYGIFYTENLLDFTLVQTEAGTGGDVQVTLTPPVSSTGQRFWIVAPMALP